MLYQAFRDSTPCLVRASTSRRAINWSSEEAHLVNITFIQRCHPRISTERLDYEDGQFAVSLDGESRSTPAENTLSHSYFKARFWRERARDKKVIVSFFLPEPPKAAQTVRFECSESVTSKGA